MIADRPPALRGEAGGLVLWRGFRICRFRSGFVLRMMMRAVLLVWILLLGGEVCGGALADEPQAPPPAADTLHPPQAQDAAGTSVKDESWWRAILRAAPNCKSFSDGCRQCDVDFQCSGLPIACQPKEFTCADPKP